MSGTTVGPQMEAYVEPGVETVRVTFYVILANFVLTCALFPITLFAVLRKTPPDVCTQRNLYALFTWLSLLLNGTLFVGQPVLYGKYLAGYTNGPFGESQTLFRASLCVLTSLFAFFCVMFSVGFGYQSYKMRPFTRQATQSFYRFLEEGHNFARVALGVALASTISTFLLVNLLFDVCLVRAQDYTPDMVQFKAKHPSTEFVELANNGLGVAVIATMASVAVLCAAYAIWCNVSILRFIHSTHMNVSSATFRMQLGFYRHYVVETALVILLFFSSLCVTSAKLLAWLTHPFWNAYVWTALGLYCNLNMVTALLCVVPYRRWLLAVLGVGAAGGGTPDRPSKRHNTAVEALQAKA